LNMDGCISDLFFLLAKRVRPRSASAVPRPGLTNS
jgi:hypothetical protein